MSPFDPNDKNNKDLVVAKEKSRSVHCKQSQSTCEPFYLFGVSSIDYQRYSGILFYFFYFYRIIN